MKLGFPPKEIPPFSWVMNRELQKYDFQKFIEAAKVAKGRRDQSFSAAEESLFLQLWEKHWKKKC